MGEAGLKDYGKVERWWAVFAPDKTPEPITERLQTAFNRIVASDEAKKFLANVGAESFPGDSKSLQTLLASEVKRWGELVDIAGIEPK
jgi:tripartite-type tricarboxylate transporter receptor subunit TctC